MTFYFLFVSPGFLGQDDIKPIVYNILTESSRSCFTLMFNNVDFPVVMLHLLVDGCG